MEVAAAFPAPAVAHTDVDQHRSQKSKPNLLIACTIGIATVSLVLLAVSAGTMGWMKHTVKAQVLPVPLVAEIGLFRQCHSDETTDGKLICSDFTTPSDENGHRNWCLDENDSSLSVGDAFTRFRAAQVFILLAIISMAGAIVSVASLLHRSTPRQVAYIGAGAALLTTIFTATVYGSFYGTMNACHGGYCGQLRTQMAVQGLDTFTKFDCGVGYSTWLSVAGAVASISVAACGMYLGLSDALHVDTASHQGEPCAPVEAGNCPVSEVTPECECVPATEEFPSRYSGWPMKKPWRP